VAERTRRFSKRGQVLAGDPGDLGVDGVGAAARGGGDGVGFVEDEQGLAALALLAVLAAQEQLLEDEAGLDGVAIQIETAERAI